MARFSIKRVYVSRRFIVIMSITSIICSCITIVGRYFLSDYLIYAFAPPADILAIPLYVLLCIAVIKNKPQLTVAVTPAIMILCIISLLYFILISFLPSVITLVTDDYHTYVYNLGLYALFFIYNLIVFFLTCLGKKIKKVIKFNTKLCLIFTIIVVVSFVISFFDPDVYSGEATADIISIHDFVVENAYAIFSQIKLLIAINVAVSLQAFNYLYTQKLLDNYI